jgi:hypothetical protein
MLDRPCQFKCAFVYNYYQNEKCRDGYVNNTYSQFLFDKFCAANASL